MRRDHLHRDRIRPQRPVLLLRGVEDLHRQGRDLHRARPLGNQELLDGPGPVHLTALDRLLVGGGGIEGAHARDGAELRQPEIAHVSAAGGDHAEGDRLPDRDAERVGLRGQRPLAHVAGVEARRPSRGKRLHLQVQRLRRAARAAAREQHAEAGEDLHLGGLDGRPPGPQREEGAAAQQVGGVRHPVEDALLGHQLLRRLDVLAPEAVEARNLQLLDAAHVGAGEQVQRIGDLLSDVRSVVVHRRAEQQVYERRPLVGRCNGIPKAQQATRVVPVSAHWNQ